MRMQDGPTASPAGALGARLRQIRRQQGWSLQAVEETSGGRLRASVVGAYERGERSVSLRRLQQLATFYGVPILELLPPVEPQRRPEADGRDVVIDLAALERHRDREPALDRYARAIRTRRGDGGRVLTVRAGDLDAVAALSGTTGEDLRDRLVALEIVR